MYARLLPARIISLGLAIVATCTSLHGADEAAALKAQAIADFNKAAQDADLAARLQVTARNELIEANEKAHQADIDKKLPAQQIAQNEMARKSEDYRLGAKIDTAEAQNRQAYAAVIDKQIKTIEDAISTQKAAKPVDHAQVSTLEEVLKNDQAEEKGETGEAARLLASAKQKTDLADKLDALIAQKSATSAAVAGNPATSAATATPAAAK